MSDELQETATAIEEESEVLKCNCDEPYVTSPCPVHGGGETSMSSNPLFGSNVALVTDVNLTPDIWGKFEGFVFTCPICSVPAVMVNNDMSKFCCNCGSMVEVKSKIVTDFVRHGIVPSRKV